MVKSNKSKKHRNCKGQGFRIRPVKSKKVNASTPYDPCKDQLSPFGGVLARLRLLLISAKELIKPNVLELLSTTHAGMNRFHTRCNIVG